MLRPRRATGLIIPILVIFLSGCGGGSGGGGGDRGSGDGGLSDLTVVGDGWVGGGHEGWVTSGESPAGDSPTHLREPGDVFLAPDGFLYVADTENDRIVKWTANGQFVGSIGDRVDGWQTELTPHPWAGGDLRSFYGPVGLVVDDQGDIYVADRANHRVTRWSRDGIAQGWIGGGVEGWQTGEAPDLSGTVDLAFAAPEGVCLDADGYVYVTDVNRNRVCRWHRDGTGHGWIGGGQDGWRTGNHPPKGHDLRSLSYPSGIVLGPGGHLHDGEGQSIAHFRHPTRVRVAPDGTIYVVDTGNHRVCRFDPDGEPRGWIGGGSDGWKTRPARRDFVGRDDDDDPLYKTEIGRSRRKFRNPAGLWVAPGGELWIADMDNSRICVWTPGEDATSPGWFGHGEDGLRTGSSPSGAGTGPREFAWPSGVAVGADGTVFVVNEGSNRICRWRLQ